MKKTAMILVLAMGMTPAVFAQLGSGNGDSSPESSVSMAKSALRSEKEEKAFSLFLKAAKKGNPEAQNMLGKCYENGIGVLQNDREAAVWYKKSAYHGYADGQNNLANCYMHGTGLGKDDRLAIKYYHMAASHGSVAGAYNLGYCYETGYGLPRNKNAAMYFYKMAARKGYTLAESRLRQIER